MCVGHKGANKNTYCSAADNEISQYADNGGQFCKYGKHKVCDPAPTQDVTYSGPCVQEKLEEFFTAPHDVRDGLITGEPSPRPPTTETRTRPNHPIVRIVQKPSEGSEHKQPTETDTIEAHLAYKDLYKQ